MKLLLVVNTEQIQTGHQLNGEKLLKLWNLLPFSMEKFNPAISNKVISETAIS